MSDTPVQLAGGVWPILDSRAPAGAGMSPWEFVADCIAAARAAIVDEGLDPTALIDTTDREALYVDHGLASRVGIAAGLYTTARRAQAVLSIATRSADPRSPEAVATAFIHMTQLRCVLDGIVPGGIAAQAVAGGKALAGSAAAGPGRRRQAEQDVMDRYGRLALEFARTERRTDPDVKRAEIIRRLRIAWPSMTARASLPGDRSLSDFLVKHGIT